MINYLGKLGLLIDGSLSKKWYCELQLFALTRNFKDGITFFNFNVNLDRYVDNYKPSFEIKLIILNVYNEFSIYHNNY